MVQITSTFSLAFVLAVTASVFTPVVSLPLPLGNDPTPPPPGFLFDTFEDPSLLHWQIPPTSNTPPAPQTSSASHTPGINDFTFSAPEIIHSTPRPQPALDLPNWLTGDLFSKPRPQGVDFVSTGRNHVTGSHPGSQNTINALPQSSVRPSSNVPPPSQNPPPRHPTSHQTISQSSQSHEFSFVPPPPGPSQHPTTHHTVSHPSSGSSSPETINALPRSPTFESSFKAQQDAPRYPPTSQLPSNVPPSLPQQFHFVRVVAPVPPSPSPPYSPSPTSSLMDFSKDQRKQEISKAQIRKEAPAPAELEHALASHTGTASGQASGSGPSHSNSIQHPSHDPLKFLTPKDLTAVAAMRDNMRKRVRDAIDARSSHTGASGHPSGSGHPPFYPLVSGYPQHTVPPSGSGPSRHPPGSGHPPGPVHPPGSGHSSAEPPLKRQRGV